MTSRDRIRRIMSFEIPDRIGVFDWHWNSTRDRWAKEGLPKDTNYTEYFGLDMVDIHLDQSFRLEKKILEEDEETYIERNSYGMTWKKWKGVKQGAPHQIDTKVKTRSDWEQLKERFLPSSDRFSPDVVREVKRFHDQGYFVNYWYLEPFELVWRFMGFKETLMLLAQDPGLASELFEACADQIIGSFDEAVSMGVEFDGNFVGGDLAGKNGPLFSPEMYRELLLPHHKRIFHYFNKKSVPTIYHGDGDERLLLDLLLEAGIVGIHPLEVKAGMDVREIKKRYHGRLVLLGGIDVRALSGTKDDIEKELESKLPVAMEGGGYIYCVDHSVAPTVSLENYEYALELVREIGRY